MLFRSESAAKMPSDDDDDDEISISMPDSIPEPTKVWKEQALPKDKVLLDFEAADHVSKQRYKTFPNGYDGGSFVERWRDPEEVRDTTRLPTATISCSDTEDMKRFIEDQLRKWEHPSSAQYKEKLTKIREKYEWKLDHTSCPAEKNNIRMTMDHHLRDIKKRRDRKSVV